MKKWFWLVGVAFLVRLIGLNQSLWLDEAVVAEAISKFGFLELITKFAPTDFHPPLYYLLLNAWTTIFGTSEIALRLPSVIFSLGAGILLFSLGGFWASAFLLFNPLFVYYSQEARMYTLVTFLLTLVYWAIRKNRYLLAALATVLSLWSFYGAVFFISTLVILMLLEKNYRAAFYLALSLGLAVLLISPLLYLQYQNSLSLRGLVANWSSVLGPASLKNLLLIPLKFAAGRISFEPKILYYGLSGIWAFIVWVLAAKGALNSKGRPYTWLIIAPLVMGLIFSLFTPLLQYFRFLYLLPFLAMLLSLGIPKSWVRAAILTGFVIFSLAYLLLPRFHREDWKNLSRSLPKYALVYGIPSSLEAVRYYRPDLRLEDIRQEEFTTTTLWAIPYTLDIYGINVAQLRESQGYDLVGTASFRELVLERWAK